MNILIAGGTGLIGSALTRSLRDDGHEVWWLTRNTRAIPARERLNPVAWDGRTSSGWGDLVAEMDAVVNLVGATIAAWPWTASRKLRMLTSRVDAGVALTRAIEAARRRPQVLVQASGIGYYGPCGEEGVAEDSPAGEDFFADLSQQWEASSRMVDALGVRRVVIRTAVVLSMQGGILPLMSLPFRLFAGGRLGNGRQGFPWIHIRDEVGAIRFLMENPKARGVFNLTAPNPVSNAEFSKRLAQTLRRPYWLHVPAFVLRLALGEMSALLLSGQYAVPKRLIELDYQFKYQQLHEALADLLAAR